jgi:hypothetical protein
MDVKLPRHHVVTDNDVNIDMIWVVSRDRTIDSPDVSSSQFIDVDSIAECRSKSTNADRIEFTQEQRADLTLKICFY